jgi:UDP-glucuronate 4-epimerase
MALFLFTKAILEGRSIDVFNYGEMQRDFTYVDVIVEGIVRVIDNPPKGVNEEKMNPSNSTAPYKIYNIGNNNPVKLMDFIEALEKKIGKVAQKNMLPLQAGDVPSTYADVTDLIEDLDYKPETSIEEGIDKFVDWYVDFFHIQSDKYKKVNYDK